MSETKNKYTEAVGRRKTSVARVRLMKGKGDITVNDQKVEEYFQLSRLRLMLEAPLERLKLKDKVEISAKVSGGGLMSQAEAIRHGIARAIVMQTPEMKLQLRAFGFLTRDSRMVERKKYGLKKARRAPQWAKR
ncbi:MAG: 30S ribosomal protein S9 [Candidatus Liptonbacteria bacterium]|nr:30S ribosomal protein S9 [Candidatus Liptonbacteria bacterium]